MALGLALGLAGCALRLWGLKSFRIRCW